LEEIPRRQLYHQNPADAERQVRDRDKGGDFDESRDAYARKKKEYNKLSEKSASYLPR
jgi:hypothetical protein